MEPLCRQPAHVGLSCCGLIQSSTAPFTNDLRKAYVQVKNCADILWAQRADLEKRALEIKRRKARTSAR